MTTSTNKKYIKRSIGDVVNGAVLVERVNGQRWKMRCGCGEIFVAQPSDTNGLCRKCAYEKRREEMVVHGDSARGGKKPSRLYNIWLSMRQRCNNPKNPKFACYGGRGVVICDEWDDFITFKSWALTHGYNDDLTIDRIDNNKGYCPDNCRWVTWDVQRRNKRRLEYKYGRDEHGRFMPMELKMPEMCDIPWREEDGREA